MIYNLPLLPVNHPETKKFINKEEILTKKQLTYYIEFHSKNYHKKNNLYSNKTIQEFSKLILKLEDTSNEIYTDELGCKNKLISIFKGNADKWIEAWLFIDQNNLDLAPLTRLLFSSYSEINHKTFNESSLRSQFIELFIKKSKITIQKKEAIEFPPQIYAAFLDRYDLWISENEQTFSKKPNKAFELYNEAYSQFDSQWAKLNLAIVFRQIIGIEKSNEYLLDLANSNYPIAQYYLGFIYESNNNYEKAIYWYKRATENGDSKAEYALAVCYHKGNGVEKNLDVAIDYYKKLAQKNDMDALYNLAYLYLEHGNEIKAKTSTQEGANYLLTAVKLGHLPAIFKLGECFINGVGFEKKLFEGLEIFKKLEALDDITQIYNVALYYLYLGYNQSDAVKLLERVIKEDTNKTHQKIAYRELGWCYFGGIGTDYNKKKATLFFEKALKLGDKDMINILSELTQNKVKDQ